jgi:hypothetical protein
MICPITLRSFFIAFVDFYANKVAPNVIEVPKTQAAIDECVAGYKASGFLGFVGSVTAFVVYLFHPINRTFDG